MCSRECVCFVLVTPLILIANLILISLYPLWVVFDLLIFLFTFGYCCRDSCTLESVFLLTFLFAGMHKGLNERYRAMKPSC
jgi:hypothetical protein